MPPLLLTELLEKSIISCYKRNFRVRVTIRVQTTRSKAITLDKADNFFDFLDIRKKIMTWNVSGRHRDCRHEK